MKKLSIFLLLPCFLAACDEENPRPPFTPDLIEADQILDNYSITTIEFAGDAEAWIGTTNKGLIRYTPDDTEVFNSSNSIISESFPIHDIAVDVDGNVWIGTNGLIKYDGNSFTRYTVENSDIPVNSVKSIAVDQANNIWFASAETQNGGLVKFDGANFTVYTPDNSDLPVNHVRGVFVDGENNVWVSSNETLNQAFVTRISGSDWQTFTNADFGFVAAGIGQLVVNGSEEIFAIIDYTLSPSLATRGDKLFSFLPATSDKSQFDLMNIVNAITIDFGGKLWYVSQHEFGVYNGEEWIIESPDFTNANLTFVVEGPQDTMWFGTSDGVYLMEKTEVVE